MKRIIFFISLILLNNSYACEETNLKTDDITIWLGSNSKFSQEYRKGKCALDEALIDLPLEQKKVIANLIAKSYTHSLKILKKALLITNTFSLIK
tara:strand:+ start:267 stop:551 length:285 start_codon:yes stop_codon:yes gene_type:complete